MQTVAASNSPAVGAITPTIPRLNDQGTFYSSNNSEDIYNNSQHQFATGYPAAMEHQPGIVDYNNGQPMMDYGQQQPYYYQQPQDGQPMMGGYYDESGYYNNNQPTTGHSSNPSYDTQFNQQTYLDQNGYTTTNVPGGGGDHYYKPDQVDLSHHQRM
jgi:hypothetical protein